MVPGDRYYTKTHEWIKVEDDIAVIGITDFAQSELTDIVFVELPEIGRNVSSGEAVAVVESVKTASDIYSPVSGEIIEVNATLDGKPELINEDPYGEGWIFKVKLAGNIDESLYMDADGYENYIKEGE